MEAGIGSEQGAAMTGQSNAMETVRDTVGGWVGSARLRRATQEPTMPERDHVAIVTGASRGLGAVVARVLAGRGFDLVICARGAEPLRAVHGELARFGGKVISVSGDVTDASGRARLVDAARSLGSLDVLVNNASELGPIGPLAAFDVQ